MTTDRKGISGADLLLARMEALEARLDRFEATYGPRRRSDLLARVEAALASEIITPEEIKKAQDAGAKRVRTIIEAKSRGYAPEEK